MTACIISGKIKGSFEGSLFEGTEGWSCCRTSRTLRNYRELFEGVSSLVIVVYVNAKSYTSKCRFGEHCSPLQVIFVRNDEYDEKNDCNDYDDNDSNYIRITFTSAPPCEGAVFIVTLFCLTVLQLKIQMFFVQKSKNIKQNRHFAVLSKKLFQALDVFVKKSTIQSIRSPARKR